MNFLDETYTHTLDKQKKVLQTGQEAAHQGTEGPVGLSVLAHPELLNIKSKLEL